MLLDSELTDPTPLVRNADAVVATTDGAGDITRIVVVEVQRERDDAKLSSWPLYIAHLAARHRAPVTLLVLAFDEGVARWARKRRSLGPNLTLEPTVIGPKQLPSIRSGQGVRAGAVLAALGHLAARRGPGRREAEVIHVFEALLRSDATESRHVYLSLLHGTARADLRARLEELLEEHGMGALEIIFNDGKAEGVALGKAEGILAVLRKRGVAISPVIVERIQSTKDLTLLDQWLDRALEVTDADGLFLVERG